jgi:hypothetical protein
MRICISAFQPPDERRIEEMKKSREIKAPREEELWAFSAVQKTLHESTKVAQLSSAYFGETTESRSKRC